MIDEQEGLVGYWKLDGDCRDHSGKGNHGENHGVDLRTGKFDGRSSHIQVENSETLGLGRGEFSICAAVYTEQDIDGVFGNILSKFDSLRRKGFGLGLAASSAGYNAQGNERHVHFWLDDARMTDPVDCGRPNEASNYVNSLTVFQGKLYVATTDAERVEDWCHVYRWESDGRWEDCGRVGDRRTPGVGPMIVHNDDLYAATWSYEFGEGRKRKFDTWDYCAVYRYRGGREWESCGQPGKSRRLMAMASYKGRLYVISDGATIDPDRRCYVYDGGEKWTACGEFRDLPACMAVHHGKLYVASSQAGYGGGQVYAYDGERWQDLGNPFGDSTEWNEAIGNQEKVCTQIHAMGVYRGELYVGCWPNGNVAAYRDGTWTDCGRTGRRDERVEINAFAVYNGKLYAGTLPGAGLWRYERGAEWTLCTELLKDRPRLAPLKEWARLTSLSVYDSKLFATVGSCLGCISDAPFDVRGKVFSLETGRSVTYDSSLAPGWKHIVAVRERGKLKLYIDGELCASSSPFAPGDCCDVTTDEPLEIGFGEVDYFSGRMREIRLYSRALGEAEVGAVYRGVKGNLL